MTLFATHLPSPIGRLTVIADPAGALVRILFEGEAPRRAAALSWDTAAPCAAAVRQLEEYFAGRRKEFDLTLAPEGSPFQQAVWAELLRIPFGETTSYAALAERVGRPSAFRAVGRANGTNPIPVVIPCHRVIGADGGLTGYGGGLDVKRRLLELEGCELREPGRSRRLATAAAV